MSGSREDATIVREAIEKSLQEWAVDRKRYSSFWDAALRRACKYYCDEEKLPYPLQNISDLEDTHLSTVPKVAIRHVLARVLQETSDIDIGRLTIPEDRLGLHFNPYYFIRDETTGELTLRPCKGFRDHMRVNPEALNPFSRFRYRRFDSAAEYIAFTWDFDTVGGHILEAMVACHLEHKMSCFCCDEPGVLRWNGGLGVASAWADVVCTNCHSMYEIKSKRDQETVRKDMIKYNRIRGGSFVAYSRFEPPGKRYLLMVGRAPSGNDSDRYHPVTIAAIDRVIPKLTNKSFCLDDRNDDIMIGSEISIKSETRMTWFTVPTCQLSYYEVAESVYDEAFGDGAWRRRVPAKSRWVGEDEEESLALSFHSSVQISSGNNNRPAWSSNIRSLPTPSTLSGAYYTRRDGSNNPHHSRPRQVITVGPQYDTTAIRRNYRRQHQGQEDYNASRLDSHADSFERAYDHKQQRSYKKASW